LAIREELAGPTPSTGLERGLAVSLNKVAVALIGVGEPAQALDAFRRSQDGLHAAGDSRSWNMSGCGTRRSPLEPGRSPAGLGDLPASLADFSQNSQWHARLAELDPSNAVQANWACLRNVVPPARPRRCGLAP